MTNQPAPLIFSAYTEQAVSVKGNQYTNGETNFLFYMPIITEPRYGLKQNYV